MSKESKEVRDREDSLPDDGDTLETEATEEETSDSQTDATEESEVPEKWRGKSPQELIAVLTERESMIGKQSRDVKEARDEATYLRQLVESGGETKPAEPEKPETQFDWANPGGSIRQYVGEAMAEFQARTQATRAEHCYMKGMKDAMASRPELFEGIEDNVKALVKDAYMNKTIRNPDDLENPETWYGTAGLIRFVKSGYKFPESKGSKVRAMSATDTEKPGSGRSSPDDTREDIGKFSRFNRGAMKHFKINEDEAAKMVRSEREVTEDLLED